jgi:hypothetical protein
LGAATFGGAALHDIHNERQLMHEFVPVRSPVSFKFGYHSTCYTTSDPDVAIDNPDYVAYCFAVSSTHVSDFGVRARRVLGIESGVFIFNQESGIEVWEIGEEFLNHRQRWIRTGRNAEADVEFVLGVILMKGGG